MLLVREVFIFALSRDEWTIKNSQSYPKIRNSRNKVSLKTKHFTVFILCHKWPCFRWLLQNKLTTEKINFFTWIYIKFSSLTFWDNCLIVHFLIGKSCFRAKLSRRNYGCCQHVSHCDQSSFNYFTLLTP